MSCLRRAVLYGSEINLAGDDNVKKLEHITKQGEVNVKCCKNTPQVRKLKADLGPRTCMN